MNRIKELREEQGISREELAKLLGISVEEYPKIEAICTYFERCKENQQRNTRRGGHRCRRN